MWNCRIILHDDEDPPWYGLHEVYYDEKGKVNGWTEQPCSFVAENDEGGQVIIKSLNMALSDAMRYETLKVSALRSTL